MVFVIDRYALLFITKTVVIVQGQQIFEMATPHNGNHCLLMIYLVSIRQVKLGMNANHLFHYLRKNTRIRTDNSV